MRNSGECTVILHISDLHFGYKEGTQRQLDQIYVFECLIDLIQDLGSAWKPDVVCITGDVTYQNKDIGYEQAKKWIEKLIHKFSVEKEGVFICPGNHELDRDIASGPEYKDLVPLNEQEKVTIVDETLKLPLSVPFKKLFHKYDKFCAELSLYPYDFMGNTEYLIGKRKYLGIDFVCNNSCWFAYNDKEVWLGKNFVRGLFTRNFNEQSPVTIALTHHPKGFFNNNEVDIYQDRQPPVSYLSSRCHLVLTGHSHARPGNKEIFGNSRWFNAGCCAQSDQYRNNFTMLRVWSSRKSIDYQRFEWDGGKSAWVFYDGDSNYELCSSNDNETRLLRNVHENSQFENKSEKDVQKKLRNLLSKIQNYVMSLDNQLAIKCFEENQQIINNEYADQEITKQIKLLISEAKNE